MVDISVLKHGNIGALMGIQADAASAIQKEMDRRTISVISSTVPAANTVKVTGDPVTDLRIDLFDSSRFSENLSIGGKLKANDGF